MAALGGRLEVQRDEALHRDSASVHGIRFEMPLPHGIDGGAGKYQRPLYKLHLLDGTIAADLYLQNYAAALGGGFRRGWIYWVHRLIQQVTRGRLVKIYRLNR